MRFLSEGNAFSLKVFFLLFLYLLSNNFVIAQYITAGDLVYEEAFRRNQLINYQPENDYSLLIRPVYLSKPYFQKDSIEKLIKENLNFTILPFRLVSQFNSNRPYGWGDLSMIPNVGFQELFSGGIAGNFKFIHFQIQPEIVWAQNKSFQGFSDQFSRGTLLARFHYWNFGDAPERFGDRSYFNGWWGQSGLSLRFHSVEIGVSTRNIWWGPGQFNSLTLSNNAQGFPHISLNTIRPLKTFLGKFEGQLISGKLKDSGFDGSQNSELNELYFEEFNGDYKYLNGLSISYQPKWIEGLYLGFSRTFQRYSQFMGNSFNDYFPVFEAFQKNKFFENGNTLQYDNNGYDQQVSVSFRLLIPNKGFEIYGEFGRRDHAFNWREAILNPEHARAYLLGFNKIIETGQKYRFFQIRSEITHTQSSNNRYVRYPGLLGGYAWHTHNEARGFSHKGQPLGVGSGIGSNVQTIEVSVVEGLNKKGILLERLANHQDFFYRAFGQNPEKKPWVDFSLGLLWDHQWERLLLSSKLQLIRSSNYQWQSNKLSTNDFSSGAHKTALFAQLNLIYPISKN
ncbi:capsule assembly Wzi family protein [Algoriphagus hitonicola]|uniref:Capsule assembly protein Wzi n=1 Tax=Algoriphagus hitonicola TaxID=435880 RepID=A0A1I2X5S9_9BACT|nr:capsule assembly Wzi family protein [Algoriphagus hitonicola]SFH08377.1 Capsule assembly protein Wzi [Algoriphagus hitonicola]